MAGWKKLSSDAVWHTADLYFQVFIQAAYLIVLSRALGPVEFGVFSSVAAISIIISTFVGIGCDQLLIRNYVEGKSSVLDGYGTGLGSIASTFPIALLIGFISCSILNVKLEPIYIGMVLISDLLFTKIVFLSSSCYWAINHPVGKIKINLIATSTKMAFLLGAFFLLGDFGVKEWIPLYFISILIGSLVSIGLVISEFGRPKVKFSWMSIKSGVAFCLEISSLAVFKDIDKPLVVKFLGPEIGGIYTAGFRVVDAATTPIRGLLNAVYTKYFKAGDINKEDLVFLKSMYMINIIAAFVIGLGIYLFSPVVENIFGDRYHGIDEIVKAFALFPFFLAVMAVSADGLRLVGLHNGRVLILIVSAAVFPILLSGFLINHDVHYAIWIRYGIQFIACVISIYIISKHFRLNKIR